MPRTLLALLGVVAVGALGWFFLRETPETVPEIDVVREGDATEDGADGPRLVGAREERASPPAEGEGRFQAHGRVTNAKDEPVAGVPIEVRMSRSWVGNNSYHGTTRFFQETLRASVTRLMENVEAEAPVRELVSDDEGRFVLRTDESGSYALHARVAPPRVSSTVTISLFDNAFVQRPHLHVVEGVPLAGLVLDAQDRPVEARVHATRRDPSFGWWEDRAASAATDGSFSFAAVPRGALTLSVTTAARRYGRLAIVEAPHDGEVVLRLPGGSVTLEGFVHDADDAPVAGALLQIDVELPGEAPKDGEKKGKPYLRAAARSATDGSVRLEALPEGEVHRLSAVADGYRTTRLRRGAAWPGIALKTGQPATLDVMLSRGSSLHGKVLDHGDKEPLAGARVTLYFLGWTPPQEEVTTTDAQGRYRFDGLGKGKFLLLASSDTHYSPQFALALDPQARVGSSPQLPTELVLELTEEEATHERDLVLARGGGIAGHVEDPDGERVAGAAVFVKGYDVSRAGYAWGLYGFGVGDEAEAATSGADGRFAIDGLPPHAEWVLYAKKSGLAGSYSDPVIVEADRVMEGAILRLVEQAVIRGQVLDAKGEPLAGQSLFLGGQNTELRSGGWRVQSNEEGLFEADGLPGGTFEVSALGANNERAMATVENLKPGEIREGVVVSFATGHEISGTVVDQDGKPVTSLPVFTMAYDGGHEQRQTSTDSNGAFRIRNVNATRVRLRTLRGGNWIDLGEVIEPPATDVRLVIEALPTFRIKGTVLGPDGEPVARCRVTVRSNDGRTAPGAKVEPAAKGAFVLQGTGEPPYAVQVRDPEDGDGTPLNVRGGYARVTDPTKPVVIRLFPAQEIGGRVVDESDEPVPGVTVRSGQSRTRSDVEGAWHLAGLASGNVALRVEPPGDFMPPAPILVAEGQQDVLIRLVKGASIAGRIELPDGVAVGGGTVTGSWPAGRGHAAGKIQARLAPSGAFRIGGIPPAARVDIAVRVWSNVAADQRLAPALVEDVEPGRTDLVVPMTVGVALDGVVIDALGAPVTEGHVNARGKAGYGWSKLDDRGRFEIQGLPTGPYELVFSDPAGRRSQPVPADAPASDLRIEVPDTASLSGTLLGAAGESGWSVSAVDPGDASRRANAYERIKVQADGTWSIPLVPRTGPWVVIATHYPGVDRYARSAPVEAGTEGVALKLVDGASIEGRVELAGRGMPRAWVRASAPGWWSYATCDGEGNFALRGLPPGRYVVTAGSYEFKTEGRQEGVATGATGVLLVLDP